MAAKYRSELKNKKGLLSGADSSARSAGVQQLHDEIDKLALLLAEVKRQSDRIQGAADALGEAAGEAASISSRDGSKPESTAAKARTRSKDDRAFPFSAATPQIDRARN